MMGEKVLLKLTPVCFEVVNDAVGVLLQLELPLCSDCLPARWEWLKLPDVVVDEGLRLVRHMWMAMMLLG